MCFRPQRREDAKEENISNGWKMFRAILWGGFTNVRKSLCFFRDSSFAASGDSWDYSSLKRRGRPAEEKGIGMINWKNVILFGAVLGAVASTGASEKTKSQWVDLFDGKTLDGWRNPYEWGESKVVDGEIHLISNRKFFLCSEKTYSDFIFEAQVKMPEGRANSGFLFRCHVKPNKAWGYQAEVDTSGRAWSGGLYDEARRLWMNPVKPLDSPSAIAFREKTEGAFKRYDWNTYRIHAEGHRLRIWVNDVLCTDLMDDMDAEGYLGLQHHGENGQLYRFRNIRIKELK